MKILGIILTFGSPENLDECVRGVLGQTRRPDALLVIDNHGIPPVVSTWVEDTPITIVRLAHNGGPAGGWFEGLGRFLDTNFDAAWLLDDDCIAAPMTLAVLEESIRNAESAHTIAFPRWVEDSTERCLEYPAWAGVLIPRQVVERVGLPRADLVWWAEDTEYLQTRMLMNEVTTIRPSETLVVHKPVRRAAGRSAAKFYYESRNTVFVRVWIQRRPHRRRFRRALWSVASLTAIAIRSTSPARNACMVLRGVRDGLLRRTGVRVPL